MGIGTAIALALTFVLIVTLFKSMLMVPQQSVWIVEKVGKFDRTLEPGINFLVPFIETVAYRQSLQEQMVYIYGQTALTRDNVKLVQDGTLYFKVTDAVHASYGVSNLAASLTQLAQNAVSEEIGKLAADTALNDIAGVSARIFAAICREAAGWGVECARYEIKDIHPINTILQ